LRGADSEVLERLTAEGGHRVDDELRVRALLELFEPRIQLCDLIVRKQAGAVRDPLGRPRRNIEREAEHRRQKGECDDSDFHVVGEL
jgi:hypothetical protein